MANDFNSNLGAYDPDSKYPSAASPLDLEELLKARAVSQPVPAAWAAMRPPTPQGPASADGRMPAGEGSAAASQFGGAGAQPPASTGSPQPAASAPDYSGLAMGQLQQGEADLTAAEKAANSPQPTSPELDALQKKIATESLPTQLRENRPEGDTGQGTGKILPQYAPSLGSKILRGLRGAGIGFAEHGLLGAAQGAMEPQDIKGGEAYGAPNKAYEQTEADRQATLASLEGQRPAMSDALKQRIDQRRQQVGDMEKLGSDRGSMGRDVTGVGTAANDTPAAKATAETLKDAADFNDRQLRWKTVGALVPPSQRDVYQAHYLLTGQMPEPQQPRQATETEAMVAQGVARYRQQFGKDPDYTAWSGIVQAAQGKDAGGAATGAPTGPDGQPLKGEDYLKTLDPATAATVRSIGTYREAPPKASDRGPQAQATLSALNTAYPGFRADIWPTLVKNRAAVTSGPIGTAINSFNTSLNHIGRMEKNIPDGSAFSTLNAGENMLAPSGSARGIALGKWDTDANAVANEVQKAYKGGTVTNEEKETMMKLLDRNAAPERMKSNLAELRALLQSKLESFRSQYESGLPPGSVIPLPTLGVGGGENQGADNPAASAFWANQPKRATAGAGQGQQ